MTDYRSRYIYGTLGLLQVGDVLSTRWSERNPWAYEANPWAAPHVHRPLAVLLVGKVLPVIVAYVAWRWAEGRYERHTGRTVPTLILLPYFLPIGIYAYVIANNLGIALAGGPLW